MGVGGDGSGLHAARTAAVVADLMHEPIVLVFGYEASPLGPRGGPLEEQIAAVGIEALTPIRDEIAAGHPGIDVRVELVGRRPVEALIETAAEVGARAIAVGHGGSGPVRAALLGSVTYEIVHRSHIPVLVVPDPED